MVNVFRTRKYLYLFIILILLKEIFTEDSYQIFKIEMSFKENELDVLYINNDYISKVYKNCEKWIPSLFSPIMLVPRVKDVTDLIETGREDGVMKIPVISDDYFESRLYYINIFEDSQVILGKDFKSLHINNCYFGLSYSNGNHSSLKENESNLDILKDNGKIKKKIFSFDNWTINQNSIITSIYYGDEHKNFINNIGIIGKCKSIETNLYWGCSFKQMSYNNTIAELTNNQIYISSENYDITFPKKFKDNFNKITKNACYENDATKEIICNKTFFGSDNYVPLKLINDDMIITIELDNLYRFNPNNEDGKNKTRIKFENVDYFILPLIMFKNFLIQFDAEKNIISFNTNNTSILELIKKEEPSDNSNEEEPSSSSAGTVILVISIILLILALIIIIVWIYKKRKASGEKNINKYNKFEDEENFQHLDEKRVF